MNAPQEQPDERPGGLAGEQPTKRPTEHIWIDTDIVFNQFAEDVDDGLALIMALRCPHAKIHGISLNRRVDNGFAVTQKLLGYFAQESIPVYKGVDDIFASYNNPEDDGAEAVDRLADALRAQPMKIVAIGAATNLANLIERHPDTIENIQEIVFCAGRQQGVTFCAGRSTRALPDANFDNDVASFKRVLDAGIPVALSGFEASSSVVLTAQDIAQIRRNGQPGDRWVASRLRPWLWLWRIALQFNGFIPFDACTIGHVLYPEHFDYHRQIPLAITERANDAKFWKKGVTKDYLEVSEAFDSPYRVDFAYRAKPSYKALLMQHLLGLPDENSPEHA